MPRPATRLRRDLPATLAPRLAGAALAFSVLAPSPARADTFLGLSMPDGLFLAALLVVILGMVVWCAAHRMRMERKCSVLIDSALEGIFQTTPGGRFLTANKAMARILGYDNPGDMVRTVKDFGPGLFVHPADHERLMQILGEYDQAMNYECELRKREGGTLWAHINARLVRDRSGQPARMEGFLTDVSDRKHAEALLRHRSLYDVLTGLPNRSLLTDRIGRAIERSRRRDDYYYALLFVDIDRLKMLNDSYGHAFGDQVLGEVSVRLKSCVRELDTVARFGNDEFVLLLEEIDTAREAARVVKRIHKVLREPMQLSGLTVQITVSTGVLLNTSQYEDAEEVLRDADIAMHRAKDVGPDRFKVFTPRLHDEAVQAMTLENDLDRALADREFFLEFQPIVSGDGVVSGFEALTRWNHPQRGLVMPADFIPVAEETGRIDQLGMWVLGEACATLARWRNKPGGRKDLTLAVNMSGRQFARKSIVKDIKGILDETGLPPSALRLEITETVLMADAESTVRRLQKLRALGVTTSIDDFGTGYSSMSYLQRFPLDNLKIDLSFVQGLEDKAENVAIVRAIISLAHSLGLNVVAEGVEKDTQRAMLAELGCELYQGFLFSRPVGSAEAELLVNASGAPQKAPEEEAETPAEPRERELEKRSMAH